MSIDLDKIQKALDWGYNTVANGVTIADRTVVKPIDVLADEYLAKPWPLERQINRMVRNQHIKAGVSGLITGAPGAPFMPLTVPADLASVLSTQLRMSAAIGYMYGHDTHSDEVRTFCYLCLAGNGAREVLAQVGV